MNNIKRKSCRQESTGFSFWRREGDTLRPHPFDRSERLPKGFAVLETSQLQNAIAHFELLRRTPPIEGSHPPIFYLLTTKSTPKGCFLLLAERGGFEPPIGFKPIHDFQSCALDQLSHLSIHIKIMLLRDYAIIQPLLIKIKSFLKFFYFFGKTISTLISTINIRRLFL